MEHQSQGAERNHLKSARYRFVYSIFSETLSSPSEIRKLFLAKFSWSYYDLLTSLDVLYFSNRLENFGGAAGA